MLRENLERNFGFILHDVARLLRTTYDRRAEVLELEKPSLGRLLDRLEAKDWIRRVADTRDRRAKRVFLTHAAEEPMQVMRDIAAGVRADALSGLSTADQDRFVDALLTIKSNLMVHVNGASKANGQQGS